jgi:hypothetical protein
LNCFPDRSWGGGATGYKLSPSNWNALCWVGVGLVSACLRDHTVVTDHHNAIEPDRRPFCCARAIARTVRCVSAAVSIEERGPEQASDNEREAERGRTRGHQSHQGENAALAAVVCSHDEDAVLD